MVNFVLVPGAWLGAWAWKQTAPLLWREGHPAYAVTLTGMGERAHLLTKDVGMETAVQDVLNFVRFNELEDYVLVGHSFAGKVAAAVADRAPGKVRKVIYLDAFRPERVREAQGSFDPTKEFGPAPAGGLGILLSEKIVDTIGKDVQGSNRKRMLALSTPWPIKMGKDPITLSKNYDAVKEAYVLCSLAGDPVDEIVAGKWGALVGPHKIIEAGHWSMITQPEQLAKDLIDLAK